MSHPSITKKQLLKRIGQLDATSNDRLPTLRDISISLVGAGVGATTAANLVPLTAVSSTGAMSAFASWLGMTAVAPAGWILGSALLGGASAYGLSQMICIRGLSEARKRVILEQYQQMAAVMDEKEQNGTISDSDKSAFIVSTKELIEKNVLSPHEAFLLIQHVEEGRLPISEACRIMRSVLHETENPEDISAITKEFVYRSKINDGSDPNTPPSADDNSPQDETPKPRHWISP